MQKFKRVQNHCVLGSIKWIDLLKFIIKLEIYNYLMLVIVKEFVVRLNTL